MYQMIDGIPAWGQHDDAMLGSIRVLHTLRPLGVAMAGEDEFDSYKD
jgi:hypothetical protein